MVTIDEFKIKVKQDLAKTLKDKAYIEKLDRDIERHYHESEKVSRVLGSNQLSVDGYVLGINMLYPDLPY